MAADDANQPPPYEGRNLYLADHALRAAVEGERCQPERDRIADLGRNTLQI